jgi:hypothetical protein
MNNKAAICLENNNIDRMALKAFGIGYAMILTGALLIRDRNDFRHIKPAKSS